VHVCIYIYIYASPAPTIIDLGIEYAKREDPLTQRDPDRRLFNDVEAESFLLLPPNP
jgi:hypothetical protein